MHKKLIIGFFTLLIVHSSLFIVNAFGQKQNNISIKGKLNNNSYNKIYFERFSNAPARLDSAAITGNSFVMNTYITETGFYDLKLAEDKSIILILSPGENVELTAEATNFQGPITLSGSPQSLLIYSLTGKIAMYQQKQDSLNKVYEQNKENPKVDSVVIKLREAFDRFADMQNKLINDFIYNHLTSLSGMLFINRLSMNEYSDTYAKYDSALVKTYPKYGFVRDFHEQVTRNILLSVGHLAPDISEQDTTGKVIPLSSLRGNVVLVDFWASWCGPCRHESPHMLKLYNDYHAKGFEIYSISLDKNRDSWLGAIRHDKLKWTHVSDLGFWSSKAAKLYNISSIPYTVLLDRKGKIVAKGLFGAEIDQRLDLLFNSEKKQ